MSRLDKRQVRRSFAAATDTYDQLAGLQRKVGLELLQRFPVMAVDGVDLGCGTGFLTTELLRNQPKAAWLALDIAWPMLMAARNKLSRQTAVRYLCADAEALPLASASVGQIYSNLALQWCEELASVLKDCQRILQPGGQLVFATFGPATLQELRAAWQQVDDYVHVNDFYSCSAIHNWLIAAGFSDVTIASTVYRSEYPSVLHLMHELKGIGAHNVSHQRNHAPTTRRQLQAMIQAYQQAMAGSVIVASYEIIWVRAR